MKDAMKRDLRKVTFIGSNNVTCDCTSQFIQVIHIDDVLRQVFDVHSHIFFAFHWCS